MVRKTDSERLSEIEKKLEQLKAQKQSLIAREKEKQRKERTHRLIQIGAEIESRLNLSVEDTKALCDYFYNNQDVFNKIKCHIQESQNKEA